ncbi:MAG: glucose PTS transporter transcription antiterminator GlcT [Clostridium sp.]
MKLKNNVVLSKVFNNNIVLVKSEGKEKILFNKGIGFGKKFGDIIKSGTEIDKIFTIEDSESLENFNKLVKNIDTEFIAKCEEIIYEISEDLGEELSENIHIGFIDHLNFAIKRLENGEEIQNPFVIEIETLYPREFDLAEVVARKIGKFKNITIPHGEIGFIALHIHSARNNGKLSNTLKYSYLGNTIVEHVEDSLGIYIDRRSLDYARFLTHIRFAIERIITKKHIQNDFIDIIKMKYKISYKIAEEIAEIFEDNLDVKVTEDEIAYLAMHVERFRVSL